MFPQFLEVEGTTTRCHYAPAHSTLLKSATISVFTTRISSYANATSLVFPYTANIHQTICRVVIDYYHVLPSCDDSTA